MSGTCGLLLGSGFGPTGFFFDSPAKIQVKLSLLRIGATPESHTSSTDSHTVNSPALTSHVPMLETKGGSLCHIKMRRLGARTISVSHSWRAGERAYLVKCLSNKREDLSLSPRTHEKAQVLWHMLATPATGRQKQEESWDELAHQSSQIIALRVQ